MTNALQTLDPTLKQTRPEFRFGQGKISGVLTVFLGWLALGAVVALHFPQFFSTPEMRSIYPMSLIRLLIEIVLMAAFALGVISLILSKRKSRGLLGISLATLATVLGGSRVEIEARVADPSYYLALDNLLLSIFFLAFVFVPLERVFARVRDQQVFRKAWRTDLAHFGVSHLLVQVTVLLTMVPATVFFHWAVSDRFQALVGSQAIWLQFIEAMFVADLFAYVAHRLFHEIPFLWRFHQIHHSSELLDWLAASRLHIVDILVTRAFGFIPLYVIGFSEPAIYGYLVWASFQAIFIHSNVRFKFGPLRQILATPQFHHWHHSNTQYNKNFAVHLPIIDMMFGTFYLPTDKWPEEYGLKGRPVPDGYLKQLVYPVTQLVTRVTSWKKRLPGSEADLTGDLIRVAKVNDVPPGACRHVEISGQAVALFNVRGTIFAIGGTCTHRGGPLGQGTLDGTLVTCPWHGAQFDVTTGQVVSPPAERGVPVYSVVVEGEEIKIGLSQTAS